MASTSSSSSAVPPPPPPPAEFAGATIYDAFPLTLRAMLADGHPPLGRSLSQQQLPDEPLADAAARRMHALFEPPMPPPTPSTTTTVTETPPRLSVDDGEPPFATRQRPERRSTSLCSRFGKFHGEVYATTERSRLVNVLKRRGRGDAAKVQAQGSGGSGAGASASVASSMTFTADAVVRCGTLSKQGSWRRNWKTRFFILRRDAPSLCYYKSEEKLTLLGAIAVTPDTLVLDKSPSGGRHAPYRIQIRTGDATLLVEAESRENQQRWIDACQGLVDRVREDKFRQSTIIVDRDPTTAALGQRLERQQQQQRPSSASRSSVSVLKTPRRRRSNNQLTHQGSSRSLGRRDSDLARLLERGALSSSSDEENEDDGDDDDEDDDEDITAWDGDELSPDNQRRHEHDDGDDAGWTTRQRQQRQSRSGVSVSSPSNNPRRRSRHQLLQHQIQFGRLAYDLVIEVAVGKSSKLMRSDSSNEKVACCVKVIGFSSKTKELVEIGTTDAVKLTTAIAMASASGGETNSVRLPFTVVLTSELDQFDQLRFTLFKTSGNSQTSIGLGRCFIDDALRNSKPTLVPLTEKSSSFNPRDNSAGLTLASAAGVHEAGMASPVFLGASSTTLGGSTSNLAVNSHTVQLVVQVFQSVPPQAVLPTTGIDMASAKYLLPTTLSIDAPHSPVDFMNRSEGRTMLENGSFLTVNSEIGVQGTRLIAVDEILRAPRSTFSLSLEYLDYLEHGALERRRVLQKHVDVTDSTASHVEESAVHAAEVEFWNKKIDEYLRQRQFLMKQERRLLEEQVDHKIYHHTSEQVLKGHQKVKKSKKGGHDGDCDGEFVAPFKRSTYKSLDLWQYLPTNMQNQFLCASEPSADNNCSKSDLMVWHTMTMGCPAAHSKGFANGGCQSTVVSGERGSMMMRTSNPASASSDDDLASASVVSDNEFSLDRASGLALSQLDTLRRRSRGSASKTSGHSYNGTLLQEDSVGTLKSRLEGQERLDIVGGQILSAAVACIIASLDLAALGSARHRLQLANASKFGYLIHFESLLSTQGKEVGMLEDFAAGAKWLRNVFVQFRKHHTTGDYFSIKKYTPPERPRGLAGGTGLDGAYTPSTTLRDTHHQQELSSTDESASAPSYLIVTIGVKETHLAVLPPLLASGKPFRLRCVLFTQGVNEKQSLAHALKSNAVKLQDRVNRENLEELKELYAIFRRVHAHDRDCVSRDQISRQHSDGSGDNYISRYDIETLDDLLNQIEQHVCSSSSQFKKNVALLMDTSDFCRELGGARVTCCKSGKDRTAMSVTLEQARICSSELRTTHGKRLCATMRVFGVRRKNVFMNTKASKFAFNEMQRKMLPDCYKPPAGTYKSGKT